MRIKILKIETSLNTKTQMKKWRFIISFVIPYVVKLIDALNIDSKSSISAARWNIYLFVFFLCC